MCGIVGAIAERDVTPILIEGLRRLEYRGYDSAGVALVGDQAIDRVRCVGKVQALVDRMGEAPPRGPLGIAHTRWATHGVPAEHNAHPMVSQGRLALVHNGIIEDHEALKAELAAEGYRFDSETDTEVLSHAIHRALLAKGDLFDAVESVVHGLDGAYAIAAVDQAQRDALVVARRGTPLVIGIGIGEHFVASDVAALLAVTRRFIFLEEGDVARVTRNGVEIRDLHGESVTRSVTESALDPDATSKAGYRHYMQKEIFEQPRVVTDTWHGLVSESRVLTAAMGPDAEAILPGVRSVTIVACGTSFHAGLVARYWIEAIAGVPCNVELASEYRYRKPVVADDTLFVTISQSGETLDTLAALRFARQAGYLATLGIVNVPESSMVRETDLSLMTAAGPEIGVASTKAFTTQLVALLIFTLMLAKSRGRLTEEAESTAVHQLRSLAAAIENCLLIDDTLLAIAERFADKHHALFLGRGVMFPIALEGALKLKEISYIHAEGYAAGELKHGPLALVDEDMPVIAVAPNDELLGKLKSNLQEVRARGGQLIVFADKQAGFESEDGVTVVDMPHADDLIAPIVYTVPLQLLSYHVAVLRGTDVDQPRNLAKSVTVE